MSKANANQVSYLPAGIVDVTPVSSARGVDRYLRYEDGSARPAVSTAMSAERLYGIVRWYVEGRHLGMSPAS